MDFCRSNSSVFNLMWWLGQSHKTFSCLNDRLHSGVQNCYDDLVVDGLHQQVGEFRLFNLLQQFVTCPNITIKNIWIGIFAMGVD